MKSKTKGKIAGALLLGASMLASSWILKSAGHADAFVPFIGIFGWLLMQMGQKDSSRRCGTT